MEFVVFYLNQLFKVGVEVRFFYSSEQVTKAPV